MRETSINRAVISGKHSIASGIYISLYIKYLPLCTVVDSTSVVLLLLLVSLALSESLSLSSSSESEPPNLATGNADIRIFRSSTTVSPNSFPIYINTKDRRRGERECNEWSLWLFKYNEWMIEWLIDRKIDR